MARPGGLPGASQRSALPPRCAGAFLAPRSAPLLLAIVLLAFLARYAQCATPSEPLQLVPLDASMLPSYPAPSPGYQPTPNTLIAPDPQLWGNVQQGALQCGRVAAADTPSGAG